MEFAGSLGTLATFAVLLALGGALVGLLAGLFGIGGGAVLVLIFYQVMAFYGVDEAVRMHLAIGTALAIIIPTSIRSFTAHRARGAVDEALLRRWIVPVTAGVALGTLVASLADSTQLKFAFAMIAYLVAFRMLFARAHWRLGDEMPGEPLRSVYGVAIGLLSVLMGIGGGALANTVMTLYGRPIHQAVATSSGLGVIISIPGAIGFVVAGWGEPALPPLSLGYVNLAAFALIIPITMLTAPLGVRLAHFMSKRQLETGFGLFLVLIATRFLVDIF